MTKTTGILSILLALSIGIIIGLLANEKKEEKTISQPKTIDTAIQKLASVDSVKSKMITVTPKEINTLQKTHPVKQKKYVDEFIPPYFPEGYIQFALFNAEGEMQKNNLVFSEEETRKIIDKTITTAKISRTECNMYQDRPGETFYKIKSGVDYTRVRILDKGMLVKFIGEPFMISSWSGVHHFIKVECSEKPN